LSESRVDRLAKIVGTSVFIGYFPIFPGTVGSLPGLIIYIVLSLKFAAFNGLGIAWSVLLGAIFVGGAIAADRCERIYGNDDKRIVIDEVWGMLVALQGVPLQAKWLIIGFLMFRFFDVVKPYPARKAERLGGGIAIMLDDGIAGAYSAVIVCLLRLLAG